MSTEKMKLMTLTEDAWHFRLIKFVFKSIIPDPSIIFNGCAYFWVTIGAILFLPFFLIGKAIIYPFKLIGKGILIIVKTLAITEVKNLITKEDYYSLHYHQLNNLFFKLYTSNLYSKKTKLISEVMAKEMNFKDVNEAEDFLWQNSHKRGKQVVNNSKPETKSKISEWLHNSAKIKKTQTALKSISLKPKNYGKIVIYTQRAVALLVTAMLSFAVITITSLFSKLIVELYLIWNTAVVLASLLYLSKLILGVILGVGIVLGFVYSIDKLKKYLTNTQPSWYRTLLLVIITGYKWILEYPFRFIILTILYKWIIYQFLWGIIRGFIIAILTAANIFAEYFSFEYKAFCPGIEWKKKNNQ